MKHLPSRKSIRLKSFNYSSPGWYYVTICTRNRECLFENITTAGTTQMTLNHLGKIIHQVWETTPKHHPVALDIFQIMPNHIHSIIRLMGQSPRSGGSRPAPTLGTIIGLFKSECTKQIRRTSNSPAMIIWQRNYYESIIKTETDLQKIRKYIKINPQMWHRDRNNPNIQTQIFK